MPKANSTMISKIFGPREVAIYAILPSVQRSKRHLSLGKTLLAHLPACLKCQISKEFNIPRGLGSGVKEKSQAFQIGAARKSKIVNRGTSGDRVSQSTPTLTAQPVQVEQAPA